MKIRSGALTSAVVVLLALLFGFLPAGSSGVAAAAMTEASHVYDGSAQHAGPHLSSGCFVVRAESGQRRSALGGASGAVASRVAAGAEGGETVQLFRHADPTELADIRASGEFRLGPNSTGKYFAESAEHAERWGQWLNGGEGGIVETSVPRSFADQLMSWEKLDGIGPARFVRPGQLDWLNRLMNGIREVP